MAKPTLLVVEDRELALLLRRVLRSTGYRVLICRTGGHAARICARLSARVDLVLMSFTLPDRDGMELAIQLKNDFPRVKVMGMSIYKGGATEMARLGVEFIQKPFNFDELISRIREVLGGSQ